MIFRLVLLLSFILLFSEAHSQCTIESRIYLPKSSKTVFDWYAASMDVEGGIMVVGAPATDSLESEAGLVHVYELGVDEKWKKVADLIPSDPQRYLNFGKRVCVYGNTIAVEANAYDSEGYHFTVIYIYEKESGESWSSQTETYKLANAEKIVSFKLFEEELIAVTLKNGVSTLSIFNKAAGILTLAQSIAFPMERDSHVSYDYYLSVSQDFVAIAVPQFNHTDFTFGVVFVYERNNGVYETTPKASLRPSAPDLGLYQGSFAESVYIEEQRIYVLGSQANLSMNNRFLTTVYIYEEPIGGWQDMTETNRVGYEAFPAYEPSLYVKGDYIFVSALRSSFFVVDPALTVQVFKKTTPDWAQGVESFQIHNPFPGTYFGKHMDGSDTHLVFAAPAYGGFDNFSKEMVLDYFSPDGDWKNLPTINQQIMETNFSASGDWFGSSIAVEGNFLAIGASHASVDYNQSGKVLVHATDLPEDAEPYEVVSQEPESFANFGNAVAMGDSFLFVAAIGKDSLRYDNTRAFYDIGKVYIYVKTDEGWKYKQQVIAPTIRAHQNFGQALAYSNNYLAVSEYYEGDSESDGRVHIYKRGEDDHFRFLATLRPSYDIRGDFFGRQIVMNDSLIVIGTGNPEFTTGQSMHVFVFAKNGEWQSGTEDAQLYPAAPKFSDRFGYSIAMYDDVVVVGAPRYPGYWIGGPVPIENSQGSAYLFLRPDSGWKGVIHESAQLYPSDPVNFNYFGFSVGVEYDDIFIGAPHTIEMYNHSDKTVNHDGTIKPGKIYHYTRPANGWTSTHQEKRQLESFEPEWLDGYGYKILVTDRYLYSSALFDDTEMGFQSGSVQTLMQLPIIRPMDPLCLESGSVQVKGFPRKGEWSGAGIDSSTGIFNPALTGVGMHPITYTYSGCTTESSLEVVSFDLTILDRSAEESTKCHYNTIPLFLLSNKPKEDYSWSYKMKEEDSFVPLNIQKDEMIAEEPGYYQVSISHEVCPPFMADFMVTDESAIEFTQEETPILCSDEAHQFTISPAGGVWSGINVDPSGVLTTAALADGNHEVMYSYTTALGCVSKDTVQFSVDKLLIPSIEKEGDKVCFEVPVILHARGVDAQTSIEWISSTDHSTSISSSLNIEVIAPADYVVRAYKHSCMIESLPQSVEARIDSLFVPNVITVNGDSRNDAFKVIGADLNNFKAEVFNRYGQLVFSTGDPGFIWNAENVGAGVYYWRIQYANCASISKEQMGWLHIVK